MSPWGFFFPFTKTLHGECYTAEGTLYLKSDQAIMLTDWPDSWVTNVQRYWGFRVIILQLSAAFWGEC